MGHCVNITVHVCVECIAKIIVRHCQFISGKLSEIARNCLSCENAMACRGHT